MLDSKLVKDLEIFAAQIRLETFKTLVSFKGGHAGGSMSIADVLAVLYKEIMRIDPQNPTWEGRDYFTLSKGHAGPAVYATLALKGFFPKEKLNTLNANGTMLPSHCSRMHTPGVDLTTGSLGTGISAAIGVAIASKVLGGDNYSYCIVGDGECNEGQIWEGIMLAGHRKLDNFVLMIDSNKMQLDGPTKTVCDLGNLADKLRLFNFYTQEIDGHDVGQIYTALMNCKNQTGQANAIVLNTIKGKGLAPAEEALRQGKSNHYLPFLNEADNKAEEARLQAVIDTLVAERSAL